jgi:hypothetical protein
VQTILVEGRFPASVKTGEHFVGVAVPAAVLTSSNGVPGPITPTYCIFCSIHVDSPLTQAISPQVDTLREWIQELSCADM